MEAVVVYESCWANHAAVAWANGTFDPRIRGPLGSAGPAIVKALEAPGHRQLAQERGFIVAGAYSPTRPGELEEARRADRAGSDDWLRTKCGCRCGSCSPR